MNTYPYNPLAVGQPSFNPYLPQPVYNPVQQVPQVQPIPVVQGPRMEIQSVNGKESALAFAIGPNSSVILADAINPKIWIVTTDSSGFKAVKGFKIIPDEDEPAPEKVQEDKMSALEERLTKLEERMNDYGQSNSKSAWQNKSGNAGNQPNDRNGSVSKGSDGGNQSDGRK